MEQDHGPITGAKPAPPSDGGKRPPMPAPFPVRIRGEEKPPPRKYRKYRARPRGPDSSQHAAHITERRQKGGGVVTGPSTEKQSHRRLIAAPRQKAAFFKHTRPADVQPIRPRHSAGGGPTPPPSDPPPWPSPNSSYGFGCRTLISHRRLLNINDI